MSGEKSINTNQYCHKSIVTNCLNLIVTPFMIVRKLKPRQKICRGFALCGFYRYFRPIGMLFYSSNWLWYSFA